MWLTRRMPRYLASAFTAVFVFGACAPAVPSLGSPPTAQARSVDAVTIRAEGDWPKLDLHGILPGSGSILLRNYVRPFYDTLIVNGPDQKDPTRSTVLPYLATKWDQTPQKIVFTMRKDATCSDGTPVTPSLVKQNMDLRLTKGSSVAVQ
jgi:peptide/nickel transport system substrate-binding protein